MITRRDFLKSTGIGLGALTFPSWFTFPEPTTDIQKYFAFLSNDGRKIFMVPGYDSYEIISYIWCAIGKKPETKSREGRKGLRYYWGNTVISGPALRNTLPFPQSEEEAATFLVAFHKNIEETRNELEALIKKELGNKNIWVYDIKPPNEMKLLKRI